jgi:hypothetical protein
MFANTKLNSSDDVAKALQDNSGTEPEVWEIDDIAKAKKGRKDLDRRNVVVPKILASHRGLRLGLEATCNKTFKGSPWLVVEDSNTWSTLLWEKIGRTSSKKDCIGTCFAVYEKNKTSAMRCEKETREGRKESTELHEEGRWLGKSFDAV